MPYWIHVLCRSDAPLARQEVIDMVRQTGLFSDPRFDPPSGSADAKGTDWGLLALAYAADERPLLLHRRAGPLASAPAGEAAHVLAGWGCAAVLVDRAREARQVISVELPWRLPSEERAWQLLDQLQSHLARALDGMVYAEGDGLFDSALTPLFQLPPDDPRRVTPPATEL